ncbi:ThiF family adenylyltransferase [Corynebacterium wankanglinii]|uniref:ThiF family adenylyltransferase n=1 Tax=Corynebacterium wankanglinii TaxID=2735136 RepID=A0A838CNI1_9CORY|nr:ThiF family adenylyltransferase [Corynebacterium wankanglinii]MBA1836200.1 ThiF family adenylyltransferase [Corynebacterium wankanglinii]
MLPERELKRTARQMNLPGFGPEQQERLHNARVLVIGAGGLGCPIMQTLAATGVGRITVWDDDHVDITNIHRQILFGASDVGRKKVEVAAERLRALQPGIEVTAVDGRLTPDNFIAALDGIDLLIDGSDTFATKFLAADAAEITGTPLVWGSVLRYRGDIALWWSGPGAPADGVGLRDLYPTQPDADSVPDCATAGVLGVTTSVVGSLMATEAVKFLTGVGNVQVGRLHMYDALSTTIRRFTVARDPVRPLATRLSTYTEACTSVPSTEGRMLYDALTAHHLPSLDVREPHEKAISDLPAPGLNLPLSEVERDPDAARRALSAFSPGDEVVVYCAGGVRSEKFVAEHAELASTLGISLTSLPGGVQRWV